MSRVPFSRGFARYGDARRLPVNPAARGLAGRFYGGEGAKKPEGLTLFNSQCNRQ